MDIVTRSLRIFDRVIVAVLNNPQKLTLFDVEERVELARQVFENQQGRVEVRSFSGLLVAFAKEAGSNVLIRGLRAISDYDYEAQMALMNKNLSDDLETLFMVTRESNSYISSSLVKNVAELGGDVANLVPPKVYRALKGKIKLK